MRSGAGLGCGGMYRAGRSRGLGDGAVCGGGEGLEGCVWVYQFGREGGRSGRSGRVVDGGGGDWGRAG